MNKEKLLKLAEDDIWKKIIYFAIHQLKLNDVNERNKVNINELILDIKHLDLLIQKLKTNKKENETATLWNFIKDKWANGSWSGWSFYGLSSGIMLFTNFIVLQMARSKYTILYLLKQMREDFINGELFKKYDWTYIFNFMENIESSREKIFMLSDQNFLKICNKEINNYENEFSDWINFSGYFTKLAICALLTPALLKISIVSYKYFSYQYKWYEYNLWEKIYLQKIEETIENKTKLEVLTKFKLQKQAKNEEFHDALDNQPWFNSDEINAIELSSQVLNNKNKVSSNKLS